MEGHNISSPIELQVNFHLPGLTSSHKIFLASPVSIRQVIEPLCNNNGVDISMVTIYDSKSKTTPLELSQSLRGVNSQTIYVCDCKSLKSADQVDIGARRKLLQKKDKPSPAPRRRSAVKSPSTESSKHTPIELATAGKVAAVTSSFGAMASTNYASESLGRSSRNSTSSLHGAQLNSAATMFAAPTTAQNKFGVPRSASSAGVIARSTSGAAMLSGGRRQRPSEAMPIMSNKLLGLSEANYHKRDQSGDHDDEHKALNRRLTVFDDGQVTDVSPSGTLKSKSRLASIFSSVHTTNNKSHNALPFGIASAQGLTAQELLEKEKMEILYEQLDKWENEPLPGFPPLAHINLPKFEAEKFNIGEHWTQFINKTDLSQRQKDQQEALWELLYTEVEYIKALYVIHDLFMCCLLHIQNYGVLNEIGLEEMFSNITELASLNYAFWTEELLPVLDYSRNNKCLFDPTLLQQAFTNFGEKFKSYTKYCIEQGHCSLYVKHNYKHVTLFKAFVVWAEAQKQCNRLKLHDLLVKPMQRITRYSLLLRAICKKTDEPEVKSSLMEMIDSVDKFVTSVDQTLKRKHEGERLAAMAERIESYEAVDLPLVDSECNKVLSENYMSLNLMTEMPGCGDTLRDVLHEGPLRLRDTNTKIDVHCVLFTDMLLFTKPSKRDKLRIIKPPIKIDCLSIHEMKDNPYILLVHLTEFNVAQAAYTLHGDDIGKWVKCFRKAQTLYRKAKDQARTESLARSPSSGDLEGDDFGFAGPLNRQESDHVFTNSTSYSSFNGDAEPIVTMEDDEDESENASPDIGRKHHTLPPNYKHQHPGDQLTVAERKRKTGDASRAVQMSATRSKSSAAAVRLPLPHRGSRSGIDYNCSVSNQETSDQSLLTNAPTTYSDNEGTTIQATDDNCDSDNGPVPQARFVLTYNDTEEINPDPSYQYHNNNPTVSVNADTHQYSRNEADGALSQDLRNRKLSQLEIRKIKQKQMAILLDSAVGVEI